MNRLTLIDALAKQGEFSGDPVVQQAARLLNDQMLEIDGLRRERDHLLREKSHILTKVTAWEDVLYIHSLPKMQVKVRDWGPGEGDMIAVPWPTPQRLTDLLDEVAAYRAADKR